MSSSRLISTDFDGTLIAHPSDGRCVPALASALLQHKNNGGLWAVNTGRSLGHAIEGLTVFAAPCEPDFLLTNEREVFLRTAEGGWKAHAEWNETCYRRHDELFEQAAGLLAAIRAFTERHDSVTIVEEEDRPVGLVTQDEQTMEEVVSFLEAETAHFPDFAYQRNTIYLRFCHRDYHKGSALGELARFLGIPREQVLAAGDHFNDIPMLDGRFAAFPCCPSNAIAEVRATVLTAGGHVASAPAGGGVAECLSLWNP